MGIVEALRKFLSCLCGSELTPRTRTNKKPFLSCLCGSEQRCLTA
ncbi:hypothetical protein VC116063_003786 [Vibrio cholerae O1 str. 116063]|nr:hypothetical protein VC116063_003786 [Vibrio cholerae O1 str. 116063]